jgi:ubiquinone/menaquinone biosynthesis C-methylase UbiE
MKFNILNYLIKIGSDNDLVRSNWVIKNLLELPKDLKLLDVGAGELRYKKYCSHLNYKSQDFAQYNGQGDGKGLQTSVWDNSNLDIVSDILNIPVDDASFDAILCTEVIEHVPDAVRAISEFERILKPGGILLLTASFNSLTHFAPYHFCGYSRYWYEYHLQKNNFNIIKLEYNGDWFSYIAQELKRILFVSRSHSKALLGYFAYLFSIPVLILFVFLKKYDKTSHDLLCFGYMVKAKKKMNL